MNVVVRARMDEALKNQATKILKDLGLTPSDAIRMLFTRIAKEQAFPEEFLRPTPSLKKSREEVDQMIENKDKGFASKEAFFDALEA